MKKFVFIFYKKPEEEQSKAMMDKWMGWFKEIENNVLEMGSPLMDGGKEVDAGAVRDLTQEMWPAGGYTIVKADDMAEAVNLAKGCPSGVVRVYEAMKM